MNKINYKPPCQMNDKFNHDTYKGICIYAYFESVIRIRVVSIICTTVD